ncbi:MAG: hypothetical protein ABIS35_01465 [Terracoccus sp.]
MKTSTTRTACTLAAAGLVLSLGVTLPVTSASAATVAANPSAPGSSGGSVSSASAAKLRSAGIDPAVAGRLSPAQARQLDALLTSLPADFRARQTAALAKAGVDRSPVRDAVEARLAAAIDGTQYVCSSTALDAYVNQLVGALDTNTIVILLTFGLLDFPTYDALFYGTTGDPAYALPKDYKNELNRAFSATKRFWDVKLDDIQIMAMHGSMLTDVSRVQRMFALLYGIDGAAGASYAASIVDFVRGTPALRGGDNPLFTLNAFAFSGAGEADPTIAALPDKMIFGDGILDALDKTGFRDVGPSAVLGHEMAHHVQYEDNLFVTDLTGPEATRRTELMADAFGTYFVTSKRGLALNTARVIEAEQNFYNVGDCSFDNPGHHGTPLQRLAAATWGADVAKAAANQGHILPSLTLDAMFEKQLPVLVAPDAG